MRIRPVCPVFLGFIDIGEIMIAYLKGKILSIGAESAIIVTGGVGYEVMLSGAAAQSLNGKTEGEVYTYLQVREDGVSLFGFVSVEEKNMFMQLITVSGVGPKMGIAVLSQMDINRLATAIATSDVKALTAVKGLGKKTAERIILELREKVGAIDTADSNSTVSAKVETVGNDDAMVALLTLGFTRAESVTAIEKAKAAGASTVEEIIMLALRSM